MRGSSDVRASHPASTPLSFDVVLWEINVAYVCVMIYLRIVRLRRSRSRSHQPLRGSGGPFSEDVGATPRRSARSAATIVLELAQSDGDHCIGEIH